MYISECIWTKSDGGDEFSSEDRSNRDAEVTIAEDDSLCKLKINNADNKNHDGYWEVLIMGECNNNDRRNKRRKKRQVIVFPNNAQVNINNPIGNDSITGTIKRRRGNPTAIRPNRLANQQARR